MTERNIILDAGGWLLTSIQLQDWDMWIKLVKKYEIYIMQEKLIKYRIRQQNKNLSTSEGSQIRSTFEQYEILKNIFDDMPISLFKEAFSDRIRKKDFGDEIEYELEKAFLYLTHPLLLIQSIGAEKLFYLLQNKDILSVAKREYGFDLPAFYSITKKMDIMNIEFNTKLKGYIQQQNQQILVRDNEIKKLQNQLEKADFQKLNKQGFSVNETPITELRNFRRRLAEFWLRIPAEQSEKNYQAESGKAFRMLMENNIRNEALTEDEQTFFQYLASELTRRSKESPAAAINCLLAVMLYCPRGRMKVENARGTLPPWLIDDYERFF